MTAPPTSGNAPLTVLFDGSASTDPNPADGDAVGLYTFNFGDGSDPVTQASPTISHTYSTASGPSGYFATLTVKDAMCGLQSLNVASTNIEVDEPTTGVGTKLPLGFQLTPMGNPSHGQVFFGLSLDRNGQVNVQAFNAAGRRVAELVHVSMQAGSYTLHWRGLDSAGKRVPAGVYLLRATAGDRVATARVVLLP